MGEHSSEVFAVGGTVVEILLSGDLAPWVETFNLHVTTVRPLDDSTVDALGGREWTYVIDLSTMTIVWMQFGSYKDGSPTIQDAIAELKRRAAE